MKEDKLKISPFFLYVQFNYANVKVCARHRRNCVSCCKPLFAAACEIKSKGTVFVFAILTVKIRSLREIKHKKVTLLD